VQRGDVITAFQGEDVNTPRDLTRRVAGTPPGTTAKLALARGGDRRTLEIKLGELPESPSGPR
jgi:serine protease Do